MNENAIHLVLINPTTGAQEKKTGATSVSGSAVRTGGYVINAVLVKPDTGVPYSIQN